MSGAVLSAGLMCGVSSLLLAENQADDETGAESHDNNDVDDEERQQREKMIKSEADVEAKREMATYAGAFILEGSRKKLLDSIVAKFPNNIVADHVTLQYQPSKMYKEELIGIEDSVVEIEVIGVAEDDKAQTVSNFFVAGLYL